jgi:hypothetical protein
MPLARWVVEGLPLNQSSLPIQIEQPHIPRDLFASQLDYTLKVYHSQLTLKI